MRMLLLSVAILAGAGSAADAASVFHMAENNVQVAMIDITLTSQYTQVTLQARAALKNVCWTAQGPNSPYLVVNGQRYPFLSGDQITACPTRRDYDANSTMTLRFQPIPANVTSVSLVEGQGGENQMTDPNSDPETRYWNFLRVPLN